MLIKEAKSYSVNLLDLVFEKGRANLSVGLCKGASCLLDVGEEGHGCGLVQAHLVKLKCGYNFIISKHEKSNGQMSNVSYLPVSRSCWH